MNPLPIIRRPCGTFGEGASTRPKGGTTPAQGGAALPGRRPG
jgi:hypothetical protein